MADPHWAVLLDDLVRSDLEAHRNFWTFWLTCSNSMVVVGCLMEFPEVLHELRPKLFTERLAKKIKLASTVGLLAVVLGVTGELAFDNLRSRYENLLETFNNILFVDAQRGANVAQESARRASAASATAKQSADLAKSAAADAGNLARGAREEADSFAAEITAAKAEAASAVTRLAGAEQLLAESTQREATAEAKLSAIKTPRHLMNVKGLVEALRPMRGTQFILNTFADAESLAFSKILAAALRDAGWIRKQPKSATVGIPALNFDAGDGVTDDVIPTCVDTGLTLHIQTQRSLQEIRTSPDSKQPLPVQAAILLKNTLASYIYPVDEHNVSSSLAVDKAHDEESFKICVGRKP